MNTPNLNKKGRARRPKNTITTKSGATLKVNRSISDRRKAGTAARAAEKAEYLSTLPKNRFIRGLVRLQPRRVAKYWFSREGGVMALKLIGISFVLGFILVIGLFAYFRKDLPKIKDIAGTSFGGSTNYYDKTGQTLLFQDYSKSKRTSVLSKDISPFMKQATVAIEDKDFYKEGAFNVRGILRAAAHDATGGSTQGGSTITQQLVKLSKGWTNDRTITRKVKELILAQELEREYNKDDILTGYLNLAPYGGIDYGVETASQDYFHTSAKNLTLEQATMLAAIPQAPGGYSPYSSPKYNPALTMDYFEPTALINRQHYILDKMVQQHYITLAQATAAKKVDVLAQVQPQAQSRYTNIQAPYFVLAAKEQLAQIYGNSIVDRGGYKVITTLDMGLQKKAEQLVSDNLNKVKLYKGDEEAMVAEEVDTGQIVMMVGGVDFNAPGYGQRNYAAQVKLPPGSSFKPYDYAAFIDNNNNVGAGSVLYDAKANMPGYEGTCPLTPANMDQCPAGTHEHAYDYDLLSPGPITLRYALGGSRNVPAIKAMLSTVPNDTSNGKVASINKVLSTASAMMANSVDQQRKKLTYSCYSDVELKSQNQCGAAAAIGDGAYLKLDDHVNGLATLARLGQAIPRTFLLSVTDAAGNSIYKYEKPKPKQVIKADTAFIINSMASDPNASYLSGRCTATTCAPLSQGGQKYHRYNGWNFAIKTGTTNFSYDGLQTSWSTKYAMVSWIGQHERNVRITTAAENLTTQLARGWMEYAHAGLTPVNWTQPTTTKLAPAFVLRNHIHLGDIEPSPTNDLYPGNYIGGSNAKNNTSQTLDRVSGKLATSCTPAGAKDIQANSNVAFWNVDIFNGGKSSINSGTAQSTTASSAPTDDVHNCNDAPPVVSLKAPDTCKTTDNDGKGCLITATITQGTHALTDPDYPQYPGAVTINVGGTQAYTTNVSDSPSTVMFYYLPTADGSQTVTATATDSVLYSGSDTATVNFLQPPLAAGAATPQALVPPTPQTVINLTAVANTKVVAFSWTGGAGSYKIYLTADAAQTAVSASCNGTRNKSCTASTTSVLKTGSRVTIVDTQGTSGTTVVK